WIWSAEVRKRVRRCKRARQYAARTVDALQLGLGPGTLEPEAVTVLKTAAGSATLGGDDDCSVRRIDAVEGGCFRAFQYRKAVDVLRVQVGSTIGEVDAAVAE